jgi:hypothetical protein
VVNLDVAHRHKIVDARPEMAYLAFFFFLAKEILTSVALSPSAVMVTA